MAMVTVYMHGKLKTQFESSYRFDVVSPAQVISALCNQVKGFKKYLIGRDFTIMNGARNDENAITLEEMGIRYVKKEIHILPVISGSGGKIGSGLISIISGAALIALGIFTGGASFALAAVFKIALISAGTTLITQGVMGILSPTASSPEASDQIGSTLFDGVRMRISQGEGVPLAFGTKIRVGGVVVSSQLDVDDEVLS